MTSHKTREEIMAMTPEEHMDAAIAHAEDAMTSHTTLRERAREIAFDFWREYQDGGAEKRDEAIENFVSKLESELAASATKIREEERAKYQDIFDWLRGSNGAFPDLSQKPHYQFRIGLEKRLKALLPSEGETNTPQGK